ncbi:HlyD family secretion protein [Pelosinus sp. sgz500959]|uniref:HlyD family secretion protein n=1 Tax=Pelosinus sp. sgz500959 TaxID=3242472 RepID=UPI00366F7CE7
MKEVKSKLSNRSMIIIVSLLIAILAVGGIWWWIRSGKVVSTDDARVKGTIVAVGAKVSGRVEKVLVDEGDRVEAGQAIVTLEKEEFAAQVEQAKANLEMTKAKLAAVMAGNRHQEVATASASANQATANLNNAQKNYERAETLYKQGAISIQQLDAAKTAADVAQAQYTSAKEQYSLSAEGSRPEDVQMAQAQVRQAQAALTNLEIQLANATVKAPISGVVALKSIENGEIVSVGQQLFSITNLADVWINANIEETYIGRIKVDQPVEFTIDAFPDKKFIGHVIEVGSATGSQFALLSTENSSSNFTKVTQRLPIKIKSEEADQILKPGMSAIVSIMTK